MFGSKKPAGVTENGRVEKEVGPQPAPEAEKPSGQHSIIPADLQITGDLVTTGDIDLEGTIHGNITCRTLTLSGRPVIEGSVQADTIRVSGTFKGGIWAKKVALTKDARMTGEIHYETLEMDPGASFEGRLNHVKAT